MAPADAAMNSAQKANGIAKKPLKILMLHGYTQSGPLFHSKTKALEKFLIKALAPDNIAPTLIYPSAPNRLLPSDIPGFDASSSNPNPNSNSTSNPNATNNPNTSSSSSTSSDADNGPDMRAWFRKDDATNTYRLLHQGMATISSAISSANGIHAICGFSQGAAVAALVAAALEPSRPIPDGPHADWARALRAANHNRSALFAVSYSGFRPLPADLEWCFAPDRVATPTLHYIGSLDTVVDEGRSRALVDACEDPVVLTHPGGHFVPIARDWAMPLAAFIKRHAAQAGNKL